MVIKIKQEDINIALSESMESYHISATVNNYEWTTG